MIVLDASVLIGFLDSADVQHAAATSLLQDTLDDELATATITLAEVLLAPARSGQLEVVLGVLRDIEVVELALPSHAAARLAGLRADTGLKMPDCCVLLTAEAAGAQLASFDARLCRAAREQELSVRGLSA